MAINLDPDYAKGYEMTRCVCKVPISMNLDFLPKPFNKIKKRKHILKTKLIKNVKAYINGETSVLKLLRTKPRKFKFKNCECISENDQFVMCKLSQN